MKKLMKCIACILFVSVVLTSLFCSKTTANASNNDFVFAEVEGVIVSGLESYSYTIPCEVSAVRYFNVENTNDVPVVFEVFGMEKVKFSGEMAKYYASDLVITCPQPGFVFLQPGEKKEFIVDFGVRLNELHEKNLSNSLLKMTIEFGVHIGRNTTKGSLTCNNYVTVISEKKIGSAKYSNATISGYVKNSPGKAIANARVLIAGGYSNVEVQTNSKGYYKANVYAYKSIYSEEWHEFTVTVSKDGYARKKMVVYPEKSKTAKKDFTLLKKSKGLNYVKTKTVDLGLQAYSFAASDDGKVIAFMPFHNADVPMDVIKSEGLCKVTFTSKVGAKVLPDTLSIKLPEQAPCVEVSKDGNYICYIVDNGDKTGYPVILEVKTGKELYRGHLYESPGLDGYDMEFHNAGKGDEIQQLHTWCVKFSPDNKYLVMGITDAFGYFWVIDWQNDKALFGGATYGQVREIEFSKDGSIVYVSSGDGNVYAYDMDGNLLWKTYVGSWATDMDVSDKYIALTTKNSGRTVYLLNRRDGSIRWSKYASYRGSGIRISPDETKIWWGNDISGGSSDASSVVYNASDGKILYALDSGGQYAGFSQNGKYLATKTDKCIYVYKASNGELLFEKRVQTKEGNNVGSINQMAWISDDGKYLIATFNNNTRYRSLGQAYYFKMK